MVCKPRCFSLIVAIYSLAALLALAALPAYGADRGFTNNTGDSLQATFMLQNVIAPEINGDCDAERKLAIRARDFTRIWLARGGVTIQQTGVDQYGRILARVKRGSADLGETLIREGLARPWKGQRENWCPASSRSEEAAPQEPRKRSFRPSFQRRSPFPHSGNYEN